MNSLATRLFLSATAWVVLILVITGIVLSSVYKRSVERAFDRRLNFYLRTLIAEVAEPDDPAEKSDKSKEAPKESSRERSVQSLGEPRLVLQVFLKYGPDGEKVIRHIARYSKPGRRVYQGYKDVKRVLDGLGIAILSTSKGVMSDREAKRNKVGGEILCTVW